MNKNELKIRNLAVIAHVDHGKTTLVDGLLRQSGIFGSHEKLQERVMDSNDLERERGITILSKNTAIDYNNCRVNIVDTPGHADFGGEVERILGMVDAALLIVDAFEGPMPQTRFVLRKALAHDLKIIVVINKIDRDFARPLEVADEVLELFIDLGANDDQCEFPYIFASAMQGVATTDLENPKTDLKELLDMLIEEVPAPDVVSDAPWQLQVSHMDYDDYVGHIGIGKLSQGKLTSGLKVGIADKEGKVRPFSINKLFTYKGLKRVEVKEVETGDIIGFCGGELNIGETLVDPDNPQPLPMIEVEKPTLQMTFSVNDSPFAGRDGEYVTSRNLRKRLYREALSNLSLRVEDGQTMDSFTVSGRGELHLGILIETMRREKYEFQISRPQVINKIIDGVVNEPFEELVLDVPMEYVGSCVEAIGKRKGEMTNMDSVATENRNIVTFSIPSRGIIGFSADFIRMTKGEGIMYSSFECYKPAKGDLSKSRNGVMVAIEPGKAKAYSIQNLENRGFMFIPPGTEVYPGMIIGEHNKPQDLPVNICKAKKLTNMRASSGDELIPIKPHRILLLEEAMSYIQDDELIEVTPKNIRLRKRKSPKH